MPLLKKKGYGYFWATLGENLFISTSGHTAYNTKHEIFKCLNFSRLEWESAVLRGTTIFRRMEEDRLRQLQHLAEQYHQVRLASLPTIQSFPEFVYIFLTKLLSVEN